MTDTELLALLDDLEAKERAATPGPLTRRDFCDGIELWNWECKNQFPVAKLDADARFREDANLWIAARNALPTLIAELRARIGQPATFDHSQRTTKHFDNLLGYCVCEHCQKLPINRKEPTP